METFKINPGEKVTSHIKGGFFLAQAMVSLKAVVLNELNITFNFTIRFMEIGGHSRSFPISMEPPYYFEALTFPNPFPHHDYVGPYSIIEIESGTGNPPVVIHFGFSKNMANL